MVVLIDMRALTGRPVETTRTLDTVVIPVLGMDAVTITNGVGTVPAEITVETNPFASVNALCGTSDSPPMVVFKVKLTCVPCTGWPVWSNTWNVSVENSWRPAPPVPLSAMLVVSAPTNFIEPKAVAGRLGTLTE